MSTHKSSKQIKKRLIECVYTELLSNPVSALKVRDLAKKSGCAPSTIYQHFSNLDELIAVASIKFFDDYASEYSKMLDEHRDLIDSYLRGWELFCEFAFGRPDIYYHLFWDLNACDLEEAIGKYYSVFPLKPPEVYSVQYYLTFLGGDVVERDHVLMRSMASHCLVSIEDARYVSIVVTSIARSLLADCRGAGEEERKEASARCMGLVRHTLDMALDLYRYRKGIL